MTNKQRSRAESCACYACRAIAVMLAVEIEVAGWGWSGGWRRLDHISESPCAPVEKMGHPGVGAKALAQLLGSVELIASRVAVDYDRAVVVRVVHPLGHRHGHRAVGVGEPELVMRARLRLCNKGATKATAARMGAGRAGKHAMVWRER